MDRLVEVAVDGVRDRPVGQGQCVGVLPQGGGGARVSQPGLPPAGPGRAPPGRRPHGAGAGGRVASGSPAASRNRAKRCPSVVAPRRSWCPGSRLNSQGPTAGPERSAHSWARVCHRAAVPRPTVRVRPWPDLGVVSCPAESARSRCRTRPRKSPRRSAASSPRRAPVSAASRTISRSSSHRCRWAVALRPPVSLATASSSADSAKDLAVGEGPSGGCPAGPAHRVQRVAVDEPFRVGPSERGPQHPESTGDHRVRGAAIAPPLQGCADIGGHQLLDPPGTQGVGPQEPRHGAVPDQRGWLPGVVGLDPHAEELSEGEHGSWRGGAGGPVLGPQPGQHILGVLPGAVQGERSLPGPMGEGVDADGDADLEDSGTSLTQAARPVGPAFSVRGGGHVPDSQRAPAYRAGPTDREGDTDVGGPGSRSAGTGRAPHVQNRRSAGWLPAALCLARL